MRKSTELSKFLRDSRTAIEQNGRLFYDMNSKFLGVSYSVFVHYETGERIPSPDYLERVAPILKVSARSLCHLWARVQMPSPTLRSFFDGVPGISSDRPVRASPEQQYRFSRSEIPYLKKHPKLWLMCVFLATHIEEEAFSIAEMSKLLGLKNSDVKMNFDILITLGLVLEVKKGHFKSRFREFNLPHDEEFTEIRNNNFNNLSGMVLKSYTSDKRSQGLAQRFTFTCRPSTLNRKIIHSKLTELEALMSSVKDEGEEVCSVVIGYSDIAKRGKSHAEK